MSFLGAISSRRQYPHIYAIVKRHCLYIGETQQHLACRWGQHLIPGGSFDTNLKLADIQLWHSDDPIQCYGFALEKVATISRVEHKVVSQFIEHRVHELCYLNLRQLAGIEMIISDTVRTAPRRCKYNWASDLSGEVFAVLSEKLKVSVHCFLIDQKFSRTSEH